jgi:DNA-binding beta-propeller fold protein YncE
VATGLSRRAARLTAALAAATALFGCPATGEEVRPPNDQFYYPTGMDISPDQGVLFVANANADLRYDSGTITVVSL